MTIQGTAGGNSFRRSATIKILKTISSSGTTNGVNALDVCLVSGFPAGQPETGAIWFGSNSACDPGANDADIDLAYVSISGTRVTVRPDKEVAGTQANNFTATGGLTACPYAPVSGTMTVRTTSSGGISGSIDVMGYGGAYCGQVRYQASISGHR